MYGSMAWIYLKVDEVGMSRSCVDKRSHQHAARCLHRRSMMMQTNIPTIPIFD